VGRVGRQRQRCARTSNLLLTLNLHDLGRDLELSDCTVTRAKDHVAVGEELHAVDAHGEEAVARADTLEEAALEVDFDDVASEGAHESTAVIGRDDHALIDALDLAQLQVLVENFLLAVVDVPDADAVVMDSHELLAGVVEEGDLVGNVHANGMANNRLSAHSLN